MVVGITDNMGTEQKWQLYVDWLSRGSTRTDTQKLSYLLDNADTVRNLQSLVLTGGSDVDPVLSGSGPASGKIERFDRRRDDFERRVIENALEVGIPILGICRGLQIANVHLGGTLYRDLEEAGFPPHRSCDGTDYYHGIRIEPDSFLSEMTGGGNGTVNSSHHQAVFSVAQGLKVGAMSLDGIVESLEWEEPKANSFFLLVQWHPERMNDFENPLSKGILNKFLSSIQPTENKRKKAENLI